MRLTETPSSVRNLHFSNARAECEKVPVLCGLSQAILKSFSNMGAYAAKPEYGFLPKDSEERTVPLTREVVAIMKKHPAAKGCPVVFLSPLGEHICSSSFIQDVCKHVAKRAGLDSEEWHMHRFRDTAATRWLRAGIDVRTVRCGLVTSR